jgi:hypothetical protein
VDEFLLLEEVRVQGLEDRACVGGAAEVAEHRGPRHALDPASDGVPHVASGDGLGGEVDRLLARPAHAVYRDGRDRSGEAREHNAEARQIRPLLPGLRDNAADDVFYLRGIYAGTPDEAAQGVGEQGVGTDPAQGASAPAKRGPDRLEDHGFDHTNAPLSSFVSYPRRSA